MQSLDGRLIKCLLLALRNSFIKSWPGTCLKWCNVVSADEDYMLSISQPLTGSMHVLAVGHDLCIQWQGYVGVSLAKAYEEVAETTVHLANHPFQAASSWCRLVPEELSSRECLLILLWHSQSHELHQLMWQEENSSVRIKQYMDKLLRARMTGTHLTDHVSIRDLDDQLQNRPIAAFGVSY